MICGPHSRTGLTEIEAARVAALYRASDPPPTDVTTTKQDDGTYTVTGIWPECPPGTVSDDP